MPWKLHSRRHALHALGANQCTMTAELSHNDATYLLTALGMCLQALGGEDRRLP